MLFLSSAAGAQLERGEILAFDATGTTTGELLRIDPDTRIATIHTTTDLGIYPQGIAFATNGDALLTGGYELIRVDRTDGNQAVLAKAPSGFILAGVAVSPSGDIFVVGLAGQEGIEVLRRGASLRHAGGFSCQIDLVLATTSSATFAHPPVDRPRESASSMVVARSWRTTE